MAIKRNKRFHAEVATSALSDIMFFLLLFFLIISTLANPNVIKMDLPKPAEKIDPVNDKVIPTVVISEENTYYILPSEKETDLRPLDQIKDKLVSEVQNSGQMKLKIAGDKKASYDAVFQVLALAESNGWTPSLAYAK
ncbi:MAG: ExbD/TolR family protein [Flavobacteriia bacterium]|jgi:biopolymer transport protein ExbD